MTNMETLTAILARLETKETAVAARAEAKEFLARIEPRELAELEQELVRRGTSLRTVQGLCQSHMEAAQGAGDKLRATLPDDHVVAVLMEEHQLILGQLARLRELTDVEAVDHGTPEGRERLQGIHDLARALVDAEPHHQREEQALFPALIALGIQGPPMVMQQEHVELRAKKHAIIEAAAAMLATGKDAWQGLAHTADDLITLLTSHIAREDNILYPMAVSAIDGEGWKAIRAKCDEIGYPTVQPGDAPLKQRISTSFPGGGGCPH